MESSLSCEEISGMLSAYYDNELSKEESELVKNHLASCRECTKKLEEMKMLSGLLQKSAAQVSYPKDKIADSVVELLSRDDISCDDVLEILSAYFDDEVDFKQQYLIEKHLSSCSDCRLELVKLKNLSNLLKASALNKGNELFNHNLVKKIRPDLNKMKDCEFVEQNLEGYLKGKLAKHQIIKLSEHLLCCKACRRDFEIKREQMKTKSDTFAAIEPETIVFYLKNIAKKRFVRASVAVLAFLVGIMWFMVTSYESSLIKESQENKKPSDAMYVYYQDYFLEKALALPNQGELAVLYEKF